jgi:hypothetical protein
VLSGYSTSQQRPRSRAADAMIAMMPLQARASKQPFSTKETLRKKKSLDAPGVLQRTLFETY